MKKKILPVLLVVCFLCLFACTDKREESAQEGTISAGVTVSFDTGFDMLQITPLHLDGKSENYMPDNPIYSGYLFLGWYYDKSYTKMFHITDGFTADTTLYARWQKLSFSEEAEQSDDTVEENGFVYMEKEDEYYVVSYKGFYPDVVIPSELSEKPVVGIVSGAFAGTLVRTVSVPASVESIEGGAFAGASKLAEVNVSSSSGSYHSENGVLYSKDCTKILCLPAKFAAEEFVIPACVEQIGEYALHGSAAVLSFAPDTAVREIDGYAFSGFYGSVTIPAAVDYIHKYAFSGATCRIDFALNGNLTTLRNGEFDGYIGSELILPASVTSIGGSPFYGCGAEVKLHNTGLTVLGQNAFHGYMGAKLVVPASVTVLGSGCFYLCTSEITFDERSALSTVGEKSFSNFRGKVTFPASVRKVERYAFYNAQTDAQIVFSTKRSRITVDETAFVSCAATVIYP